MPPENVEIVRQPLSVAERARRGLDERFAVRFPGATARIARFIMARPPHSRLRQVVLRRAIEIAYGATNRGDYDPPFALYAPDCECEFPPELASLGDAGARGRAARIEFQRRWGEEWGELRFELEELIDLGAVLVVVGRVMATGLRSGMAVDSDWANIYTMGEGLARREQAFLDRRAAFEAAGVSE